jgi:hypothetical protein
MNDENVSDVMMDIAAGYIMNDCNGCPFYGIEEYDIKQRCDSVPINCIWWTLERYFKMLEEKKKAESER